MAKYGTEIEWCPYGNNQATTVKAVEEIAQQITKTKIGFVDVGSGNGTECASACVLAHVTADAEHQITHA